MQCKDKDSPKSSGVAAPQEAKHQRPGKISGVLCFKRNTLLLLGPIAAEGLHHKKRVLAQAPCSRDADTQFTGEASRNQCAVFAYCGQVEHLCPHNARCLQSTCRPPQSLQVYTHATGTFKLVRCRERISARASLSFAPLSDSLPALRGCQCSHWVASHTALMGRGTALRVGLPRAS